MTLASLFPFFCLPSFIFFLFIFSPCIHLLLSLSLLQVHSLMIYFSYLSLLDVLLSIRFLFFFFFTSSSLSHTLYLPLQEKLFMFKIFFVTMPKILWLYCIQRQKDTKMFCSYGFVAICVLWLSVSFQQRNSINFFVTYSHEMVTF